MGALSDGTWLDAARMRRVAVVFLFVSLISVVVVLATSHGTRDFK